MKDDTELFITALSGGLEAFGPIIERYQDAVFAVALARLRDFHDAEDIAQDVFIEAFEHLGRLNNPSRLGAWLRTITIHRCIDHLRQRYEIIDIDEITEQLEDPLTPYIEMEYRELHDRVMTAIERLNKTQRETTTLFYINGYSQEEIARIQEVPIGTVKRRLHDAREKLKEEMIGLVEEVLKTEAPKEDFGKRVFEILTRYNQPTPRWQEWDKIGSQIQEIGIKGVDGFIRALKSPHSPTRVFAFRMFWMYGIPGQSREETEEFLKEYINDTSKKVRKMAFMALFDIIKRDENKRKELMPYFLRFMTDKSKKIRGVVLGYIFYDSDLEKHIPLDQIVQIYLNEKNPNIRDSLEKLMLKIIIAQYQQNDK